MPTYRQVTDYLHRAADHDMAQVMQANRERPVTAGLPMLTMPCRAGCAGCCTYVVSTTTVEGEYLAEYVETREPDLRERFIGRLFAWTEQWEREREQDNPPLPQAFTRDMDAEAFERTWRTIDLQWRLEHRACPFLNTDDYTCGIYAVRPSVCRTYHVAEPPPGHPEMQVPDACLTNERQAREGDTTIFQLNSELGDIDTRRTITTYQRAGLPWAPSVLPVAVLGIGQQKYDWQRPASADEPIPTVGSPKPLLNDHAVR